jgi:hypothetical protein
MSPEILTNSHFEEFEFLNHNKFERLNAKGDDIILQNTVLIFYLHISNHVYELSYNFIAYKFARCYFSHHVVQQRSIVR